MLLERMFIGVTRLVKESMFFWTHFSRTDCAKWVRDEEKLSFFISYELRTILTQKNCPKKHNFFYVSPIDMEFSTVSQNTDDPNSAANTAFVQKSIGLSLPINIKLL